MLAVVEEAGAAMPRAPARHRDRKRRDAGLDRVDVDAAAREFAAQRSVILVERGAIARVGVGNQLGGKRQGHGPGFAASRPCMSIHARNSGNSMVLVVPGRPVPKPCPPAW